MKRSALFVSLLAFSALAHSQQIYTGVGVPVDPATAVNAPYTGAPSGFAGSFPQNPATFDPKQAVDQAMRQAQAGGVPRMPSMAPAPGGMGPQMPQMPGTFQQRQNLPGTMSYEEWLNESARKKRRNPEQDRMVSEGLAPNTEMYTLGTPTNLY